MYKYMYVYMWVLLFLSLQYCGTAAAIFPHNYRDNLFMDGVYGLVVVFVSLVGFISLVWLKDQLGNGGGPPWLENDQQEINEQRLPEVQANGGVGGEEVGEQEGQEEPNVLDVTETMRLERELQECTERLNRLTVDKFQPQFESVRGKIASYEGHGRDSEGFEVAVAEGSRAVGSPAGWGGDIAMHPPSSRMIAEQLRDEELQLEYEQRIHREMAERYMCVCVFTALLLP